MIQLSGCSFWLFLFYSIPSLSGGGGSCSISWRFSVTLRLDNSALQSHTHKHTNTHNTHQKIVFNPLKGVYAAGGGM